MNKQNIFLGLGLLLLSSNTNAFQLCTTTCSSDEYVVGCFAQINPNGSCTAGQINPPEFYGEPPGPLPSAPVDKEALGVFCWVPHIEGTTIQCTALVRSASIIGPMIQRCHCRRLVNP